MIDAALRADGVREVETWPATAHCGGARIEVRPDAPLPYRVQIVPPDRAHCDLVVEFKMRDTAERVVREALRGEVARPDWRLT